MLHKQNCKISKELYFKLKILVKVPKLEVYNMSNILICTYIFLKMLSFLVLYFTLIL